MTPTVLLIIRVVFGIFLFYFDDGPRLQEEICIVGPATAEALLAEENN